MHHVILHCYYFVINTYKQYYTYFCSLPKNVLASTSGRTRRQKIDKTGRLSALERLKESRSGKRKYEIEEIENIYDEVDEKEYSNTVLKRQRDDWIVDDGIKVFLVLYI